MRSSSASAPTRAALTPARVADSFVAVYYRVIANLPARLPELYGPDSELHHGPSLSARGPVQIAALAPQLPLAQARAVPSIASVSVQRGQAGGFVVAVLGSFRKKDNNAAVFAQTFVLEKQTDSHDDHFFCRNDIFFDLDNAPLPGSPPPAIPSEPLSVPAEEKKLSEGPTEDIRDNLPPAKPPPAQHASPQPAPVLPASVPAQQLPPVPTEPPVPAQAPISHPVPNHDLNGDVPDMDNSSPAKHRLPSESDEPVIASQPALAPNSVIPNALPEEQSQPSAGATTPVAPPPAAAKKTWASIVSSKEEEAAAVAAAAKKATASAQDINGPSADVPEQAVEDATAQPPVSEQAENIPPSMDSHDASGRGSIPPSGQTSRAGGGMQNGHRPTHVGNRGHPRTFGPSAVVQLGSLSPSQLQDSRALSSDLRDEFGQYGYKLRHVEVKAQKGIAFIEYESAEGVRAAVSAWANGARDQGVFAGIPLNVSEKRPYNKWRPGSARGGRGGARGGRRNRPASSPIS